MFKVVKKICVKYDLTQITPSNLIEIILSYGYQVKRHDITNIEYTDSLSNNSSIRSYTYNNGQVKFVFIPSGISDDEYLYTLAFELGRIVTHSDRDGFYIGCNEKDILNAKKFADELITLSKQSSFRILYRFYPIAFIVSTIALSLSIIFLLTIAINSIFDKALYKESNETHENQIITAQASDDSEIVYYATPSGKKYHTADCSYIKSKTVLGLTAKDINFGGYTACSRCIE